MNNKHRLVAHLISEQWLAAARHTSVSILKVSTTFQTMILGYFANLDQPILIIFKIKIFHNHNHGHGGVWSHSPPEIGMLVWNDFHWRANFRILVVCVGAVSENFNDTFSPYWPLFPGHRVFDYTHSAPLHTWAGQKLAQLRWWPSRSWPHHEERRAAQQRPHSGNLLLNSTDSRWSFAGRASAFSPGFILCEYKFCSM